MAEVLMIAGKPETIFTARDFEYLVEKNTWVMKRQSISGNTQKKRMKK